MSLWFVALLFLGREKGCEERESRKFPHHHPHPLISSRSKQRVKIRQEIRSQSSVRHRCHPRCHPQACVVYTRGH